MNRVGFGLVPGEPSGIERKERQDAPYGWVSKAGYSGLIALFLREPASSDQSILAGVS
jgi:hypothetical protein